MKNRAATRVVRRPKNAQRAGTRNVLIGKSSPRHSSPIEYVTGMLQASIRSVLPDYYYYY